MITTSEYTVRHARQDEVRYLVNMAARMHEESLFKGMDFDHEQMTHVLEAAVDRGPVLFLQIIEHVPTEVPVGALLACVQRSFFGKDMIATDLGLIVEREYRGRCGKQVKQLLENYRAWAKSCNAKRIYAGTTTGIEAEKTETVLELCGFHRIGTIHEA